MNRTDNRRPGWTTPAQRWVLGLTAVATLMVMLDMLVVTTALTTIRVDLGASIEELEWTINAYVLTFAVLLLTATALGDRFGRRRLLAVGLIVFTIASAACALAPGIGWLIVARTVQGVGSAMVMPNALALLGATFPAERRAKALGVFSSVTGLATLGGPVVGGAVVQGLAWQWIFWLNVPIGLLVVPLVLSRIEESVGGRARFDIGGLLLVTGAALGLVWGLVRASDAGWGSAEVVGALAGGTLLGIGFVFWERRVREPMLPMRYFRSRAFSGGNAAGFLLYASTVGAAFFFPQFMQLMLHYGPLSAGLHLAPWTVMLFVVAPIAGARINRIGERPLIVCGLLLEALGYLWIALIATPGMAYLPLVPPLVLSGIGISMAMPAAQNAVIGAVPRSAIGTAAGTFSTLRQLGGAFGIAVPAIVFAGAGGYASTRSFSAGFGPAVLVCAALTVGGAVAGLWTPGRRAHVGTGSAPVPATAGQTQ
ncbi:MAG TPA: MFS transporter [Pseudonocardiaceae bacterium]|jgi:EmrB/QacA subfamily drug resistance transporter|nr:MFS transporter [Pseudonocardiaceae bacterium]